ETRPVRVFAFREQRVPAMVATFTPPFTPASALDGQLRERGYAVLAPSQVAALCDIDLAQLEAIAPAWDELPPDGYLRDGGSYRRRRHSCFVASEAGLALAPHRAHWQSEEYNALHGGMHRWF